MNTRHAMLSSAAVILLLSQLSFTQADEIDVEKGETNGTQIRKLLIEKAVLLKTRYMHHQARFSQGDGSMREKLSSERDFLEAEFEAQSDTVQKIALLKRCVENRKQAVEYIAAGVRQGSLATEELLLVKADHIDAQVRLLRYSTE